MKISKFTLIMEDERKGKRCIFCDSSQSVKYKVTLQDDNGDVVANSAYACNKCVLEGIGGKLLSYRVPLKTYPNKLKSALERMIEYAKFLERDSGRESDNYVDQILEEEKIRYYASPTEIEEYSEDTNSIEEEDSVG